MEVLEQCLDSSNNESYSSSSENLFIVSSSKSVNDSRKDGYSDGATSTSTSAQSTSTISVVIHGQVQHSLCLMF